MPGEVWAGIVGVFMPFLVSWLKNRDWSKEGKFFFTLVISVVLGALTSFLANQLVFSWDKTATNFLIVFTAGQAVYKLWFEASTVETLLNS